MSGNNSNSLLQGLFSVNVFVQDLVFTSSELKRKLSVEQGCAGGPRQAGWYNLSLPAGERKAPYGAARPCPALNPANPLPCNQSPSQGLW